MQHAPGTLPVMVVLDNVRSLYNTGAFFRTADACAIEKLVLCGITPRPDQGHRALRADIHAAVDILEIGGIERGHHHTQHMPLCIADPA